MYATIVEKAENVRKFCENYAKIGDGHMVEFFTRRHFDKIITDLAKSQTPFFRTYLL